MRRYRWALLVIYLLILVVLLYSSYRAQAIKGTNAQLIRAVQAQSGTTTIVVDKIQEQQTIPSWFFWYWLLAKPGGYNSQVSNYYHQSYVEQISN